ncbi:MAG TPA: hypothetical protein VGE74_11635, partial [Gemmata sp.]
MLVINPASWLLRAGRPSAFVHQRQRQVRSSLPHGKKVHSAGAIFSLMAANITTLNGETHTSTRKPVEITQL